MDCSNCEELLPLYAGGDLDEKRLKLVAGHLQICLNCQVSGEQYGDTLRLVQEFATPLFAESAYAAMRRQVLSEIERETSGPSFAHMMVNYFRSTAGLGFATALIITLALSAFYLISIWGKTENQIADSRLPTSTERGSEELTNEDKVPDTFPESARPVIPPQGKINRLRSGRAQGPQRTGHFGANDRSASRGTPYPKVKVPLPAANNVAVTPAGAGSETTLRVEIQTKDPNIRIIWFSNLPTKQNSRN